jgi:hypothetical protein
MRATFSSHSIQNERCHFVFAERPIKLTGSTPVCALHLRGTMKRLVIPTLTLLLGSGLMAAACGGSPDVAEDNHLGGGASSGSGSNGNGSGGVQLGSGSSGNGSGSGLGGSGSVGSWEGEACADGNAGGDLSPVYLVFLLDQSGSMGDCYGDRTERWEPVESALKAFFSDEASAGLLASLTLFPTEETPDDVCGNDDDDLECTADAYDTPVVPPTELPNGTVFADAMPDEPNEYGTPTAPALAGTVDYALSLKEQGHKVAIVMVTDGEPQFCGQGNTIDNTVAEAERGAAAGIPTYVIGVGSDLEEDPENPEDDNLKEIAVGGGTEALIIDPETGTPEKTRQALLAEVNKIRGQQVSCEMPMPSPPAGLTLDPMKVNIEYTTGGETVRLLMNDDCSGDRLGWRYDDAIAPTRVELCPATCDEVKSHPDAALNVVFGCESDVIVK